MRSVCLSLVALAVVLSLAGSGLLVAGAPLVEPRVLRSDAAVWSATISVEPARYADANVAFTGRMYCVEGVCSYPGPTIELKPGDTLSLTLVNKLGADTTTGVRNLMHNPNVTNLHTHGLHIDPLIDSIFTQLQPGQSYTYVYRLPANHAPGLHWYHAHKHGSSTLAVMGGQHGALVVPPVPAHMVPAAYTSMTKHLLVLSHLQFFQPLGADNTPSQGCANGAVCTVLQGCSATRTAQSTFSPFRSYSYLELSAETGDTMPLDLSFANQAPPTVNGGNTVQQYLTNGQLAPTVTMQPGEYRILKVVHAGGAFNLEFLIPQQCTASVLAIDGIFLRSAQPKVRVQMNQAARFEIQIVCASAGTYAIQGRFGDQTRITQTLLTLQVSGATATTNHVAVSDAQLGAIVRPAYLADLTGAGQVVDATFELHFSQGGRPLEPCGFWLGSGSNCAPVWQGTKQPSSTLAGNTCPFQPWPGQQGGTGTDPWQSSRTYKHVTAVGQVNEWKVYGLGMDTHPFHLHVNHVQVVAFTPTPNSAQVYTDYFTIGEWRDTLPALDGQLVVRFPVSDFSGETVLHCHFLRHEDLGMMTSIYACDPLVPGACPPEMDVAGGTATRTNQGLAAWNETKRAGGPTPFSETVVGGLTGEAIPPTGSQTGTTDSSGSSTAASTGGDGDDSGDASSLTAAPGICVVLALLVRALLAQ